MITSVEVFEQIKQMSGERLGAHPRILLKDIAARLCLAPDAVLVLLLELENRGLVIIHKTNVVAVSLTSYGVTEHDPAGGFDSDQ